MPGHDLSQVIRQIREARGLSKSAFGRVVGVDPSVVSRWELGQRQPSLDTLRHLAVMLRLSAGERLALAVAALGAGDAPQGYVSFDHGDATVSCASDHPGFQATDSHHLRLFLAVEDTWISGEVSLPLRRCEAWALAALLVTAAMGEASDG